MGNTKSNVKSQDYISEMNKIKVDLMDIYISFVFTFKKRH